MDLGKDAGGYVRNLTRVPQEWGKWDECTQVRRARFIGPAKASLQ